MNHEVKPGEIGRLWPRPGGPRRIYKIMGQELYYVVKRGYMRSLMWSMI